MATGMTDPIAELATLSTAELRARWEFRQTLPRSSFGSFKPVEPRYRAETRSGYPFA